MFSDELEHISWEETTARIHAKTDADVRRALSKEHCNVEDFMALISPAAAPYLETMARLSKEIHRGTIREDHLHVRASLHHEFLHQLLRVLRFPYQQPHAAYHTDGRRNRERIQGHQEAGTFRKFAVGDGRKSGQSRRALHSPCTGPGKTLLQQSENRSDALKNGRVCNAERTRHEWRDLFFKKPTTSRITTSTTPVA